MDEFENETKGEMDKIGQERDGSKREDGERQIIGPNRTKKMKRSVQPK
jgi:hypothetical protein